MNVCIVRHRNSLPLKLQKLRFFYDRALLDYTDMQAICVSEIRDRGKTRTMILGAFSLTV